MTENKKYSCSVPGAIPVQNRPGVFYDPKLDRTFYYGHLHAVVDGPPKFLARINDSNHLFHEIDPATGSDRVYVGMSLADPDAEFFWHPRVGDLVAPRTDLGAGVAYAPGRATRVELHDKGWVVYSDICPVAVHASRLQLLERPGLCQPGDKVPVHGQPGLYRELRADGTFGPVQHERGANAVCHVCKGPAYLGLGLEPPKCLAPVCEPAKEPEPQGVVQIMHDPAGAPWRAERIWQAYRTSEIGELITGEHPLRDQAVVVWRENWKNRKQRSDS